MQVSNQNKKWFSFERSEKVKVRERLTLMLLVLFYKFVHDCLHFNDVYHVFTLFSFHVGNFNIGFDCLTCSRITLDFKETRTDTAAFLLDTNLSL